MDRAAKVKKYRKKMMKKKQKRRHQAYMDSEANLPSVVIIGVSALVLGSLILLFVAWHHKKNESKFTYVTRSEFASLMSFFMEDPILEDLLEHWQKDPEKAVTQGQLKDLIQNIGLSEAITVAGGNDKLDRITLMDYYEQILDYLDLEETVQKKIILLLERDGNLCQTKNGTMKLNTESMEMEPFHAYQVYIANQTVLGVREESDKIIALKHVWVDTVTDHKITFSYQEREYQVSCNDTKTIHAKSYVTLYLKNGKVIKVKDVEEREDAKELEETKSNERLPETVKVLLLNNGEVHYDQVYLTSDEAFHVKYNKKDKKRKKSQLISVHKLKLKKGSCLIAEPAKDNDRLFLTDKAGNPVSKGYYGSLIVYRDAQGYYIVNKVKIEKYLYSVVASEMPASFGKEALKAQAVCARSYVYQQMAAEDYSEYNAQIDDSTNYQVYNKSEISEVDVQAVEETAGEVMYAQGNIVNAYYFSSSHGYTSSMEIWNQKEEEYPYLKAKSLYRKEKNTEKFNLSKEKDFRSYITSSKDSTYDSNSKYFRWTAKAEPSACLKELKEKIEQRKAMNPNNFTYYAVKGKRVKKVDSLKGFGGVEKIYCSKRGKSGAILVLTIVFEFGKVEVKSEYNIRSIIGCTLEQITYADGSTDTAASFLPSAYFTISFDEKSRRYLLSGGGNGHGMGMSQYAADSMAKEGWNYKKILKFFYDGITIEKASEHK